MYFVISIFVPQYAGFFNLEVNLPWGDFTSAFLYDGWSNSFMFALCVALFLLSSYRIPRETVKKSASFAVVSMFLIGFTANIYWVLVFPNKSSYGQSGVMFALYGLVFMFCLDNLGFIINDMKTGIRTLDKLDLYSHYVSWINIVMVGIILYQLILEKAQFLNESSHVAYQIHALGFLLAVFVGFFFVNLNRSKSSKIGDLSNV